jgi:hypothetical protein
MNDKMNMVNVECGVDNELREAHHVTMQDLKATEMDMSQLTHQSVQRIKEYCDHSGVTDRFTGYRNNLNRCNRDPIVQRFRWLNPDLSPHYTNIRVKDVVNGDYNQRVCCHDMSQTCCQYCCGSGCCYCCPSQEGKDSYKNRSIQLQCGINTTFPGLTEYLDRFRKPKHHKGAHYKINPLPEYNIDGRVVAKPLYNLNRSEYKTLFPFPDGELIAQFPWRRHEAD